MRLDTHCTISDTYVKEMAKKPKKEILTWLRSLPVYKGILVSLREEKLKKLADDIKQLKPKPAKSKPSRNTGADAKDNTKGQPDKAGKD